MSHLPISLRLAVRHWLSRPLRPVLCALAIAASVALVVCVGICLDSLRATFQAGIAQILGGVEIHVRPAGRGSAFRVPADILPLLRANPDIETASPRLSAQVWLDSATEHRLFDATGVEPALEFKLRPKNLAQGRYLTGAPDEVLLEQAIADALHVSVGDTLRLSTDAEAATEPATDSSKPGHVVKIVGIIAQPRIELFQRPNVYLPLPQLLAALQQPPAYTVIDLKLRDPNADLDAYVKRLQKSLGPVVAVKPALTRGALFANVTRLITIALVVLSMISGTCALLIIGTTLSVGVQERVRQFGQLRCLGASRRQLVVFLIAEAALLMVTGIAAGLALGVVLSLLITHLYPSFFAQFVVSPTALGIAAANGAFATIMGSLIPAWQVSRITPMEAVRSAATISAPRQVWRAALVGLGCLAAQLLLWYGIPDADVALRVYVAVGIPLVFVGYCLLAPASILLAERLAAAAVGALFDLRPALLRHAWSRTPWRAGAMIAALMIGVILFAAARQRAAAITTAFNADAQLPDVAFYSYRSVPDQRIDKLRQRVPGLQDSTTFAVFNPATVSMSRFPVAALLSLDGPLVVAIDPPSFRRMVRIDFVEGDPDTAFARLAEGGYVFIAPEYRAARHIKVGDTITLRNNAGKPVNLKVAAVVTSKSLDLIKSYFDANATVADRAATSVLGSLKDARQHFGIDGVNMLIVNLEADQPVSSAIKTVQPLLDSYSMSYASAAAIKESLSGFIARVTNAMSLIAFCAMAMASLGVANMVIASVRARRFEFGILRAVGAGRSQLVRLLLAEVTLIALCAGGLGMIAGLHYAFMSTCVDQVFGVLRTSFMQTAGDYQAAAITFTIALAVTVALGWLAAIYPAWRAATVAQRTILAAGRAG